MDAPDRGPLPLRTPLVTARLTVLPTPRPVVLPAIRISRAAWADWQSVHLPPERKADMVLRGLIEFTD